MEDWNSGILEYLECRDLRPIQRCLKGHCSIIPRYCGITVTTKNKLCAMKNEKPDIVYVVIRHGVAADLEDIDVAAAERGDR